MLVFCVLLPAQALALEFEEKIRLSTKRTAFLANAAMKATVTREAEKHLSEMKSEVQNSLKQKLLGLAKQFDGVAPGSGKASRMGESFSPSRGAIVKHVALKRQ